MTTNERFIELLLKDLTGEISEGEKTELELLLAESEYYSQQATLYKLFWKQNSTNKFNSDRIFNKVKTKIRESEAESDSKSFVYSKERSTEKRGPNIFISFFLKTAAVVVLVAGAYVLFNRYYGSGSTKELANRQVKETPRGVKSTFILTDGTRISLNSGSKLEFPERFTGRTREVYLKGEAFFDVREDAKRPFIIHTDKMSIKVLGTAFNVKSYPNEKTSEATLIRGSIAVTLNKNPTERIILKPSQKLVVDNERKEKKAEPLIRNRPLAALTTITYFQNHDTTVVETSWVNNKLVFKNEDFFSVANKMERWYNVDFQFNRLTARDLKFTGVFETETIEEALRALQLTENFNYRMENSKIIIY